MPTPKTAFDRYVAEQLKSPTFAAEFERVGIEIRAVDDLIKAVDAARLDLGMSKAELARKVSTTPEAMRRLLTADDVNPTFNTILSVLEAVGLRFGIVPDKPSKASTDKPLKAASILEKLKASMTQSKPARKQHGESAGMFSTMKPASKSPRRDTSVGVFISKSQPARKRSGDAKHRKTA
jgi:DNA-binding phage protein